MSDRSDAGMAMPRMTMGGTMMMSDGGMMGDSMPAMNVRAEDTPTGAALVMSPADPSKVGAMRERMRERARTMNEMRGCQ